MTRNTFSIAGLALLAGGAVALAASSANQAVQPAPPTGETTGPRGPDPVEGVDPPCPEDLSGNGLVDFADILAVIAAWGPCGVPCPEDLSGNGVVDFADILAVIAAWGPCPLPKCCIPFTEADLLAFWEDPVANPLPDTCVDLSCADCAAAGGTCYLLPACPLVTQTVERMVDDAMGARHETCSALNCPPEQVLGCVCGSHIDALFTGAIPCGDGNGSFDDFGAHPLPPGFFGPGSDPFVGVVCMRGEPLGATPFGVFDTADTLIERSADPFTCTDPPGVTTIEIQIVALSLTSVQPFVVTFNGGQNPQLWDMRVDLSELPQQSGFMDVTKEDGNGGHFAAFLPVRPRFTFNQVGNPSNEQVLDTGLAGIPPLEFNTAPTSWVHDVGLGTVRPEGPPSCFNPAIAD